MSVLTRDDLEKQAKHEVCSCWYYDLADSVDAVSDEELQKFIDIPMYGHLQNQIENPVSADEFMEEITNCYKTNYKISTDRVDELLQNIYENQTIGDCVELAKILGVKLNRREQ